MNIRVGQGYDVHQLVEGRDLILGGVNIPFEKGLLGHSDADALLHAITDALLGAAGLGDIGSHFPDTTAEFKDADSRVLLREAYQSVQALGWKVVNVDTTVIAQNPNSRHIFRPYAPTLPPIWGFRRPVSISKAKLTKNSAIWGVWKPSRRRRQYC